MKDYLMSEKIFCAMCGSMCFVSMGFANATSGCILPQLEEENDDLQLTEDQGSWFGKEL